MSDCYKTGEDEVILSDCGLFAFNRATGFITLSKALQPGRYMPRWGGKRIHPDLDVVDVS